MKFGKTPFMIMSADAGDTGGAGGTTTQTTTPATTTTTPATTTTAPTATPPASTTAPASITGDPAKTSTPSTNANTGDAVLDYAVSFIEGAGITSDSAAMVAAMNGDFSLLQVEFMQKGTQGGDKIVAILEQKFKEQAARQQADIEATNKLIFEAVGGEDQWKAIQTWAKANAEPEEITAVNAVFKQGGVAAKMMAHYLALQYQGNNGNAHTGVPVTRQESANVSSSQGNGKLTRAEYTEAVTALRAKVGYNIDNHPEYHALRARLALK